MILKYRLKHFSLHKQCFDLIFNEKCKNFVFTFVIKIKIKLYDKISVRFILTCVYNNSLFITKDI